MDEYKIIFLGPPNCGKTTLLSTYINNEFDNIKNQSIGLEFYSKIINYHGRDIKIKFWDFNSTNLLETYCQYSDAIILVYDISDPNSLDKLSSLYNKIIDKNKTNIIYLVGNKLDKINNRKIKNKDIINFMNKYDIKNYLEISAKNFPTVTRLFSLVLQDINNNITFDNQQVIQHHCCILI